MFVCFSTLAIFLLVGPGLAIADTCPTLYLDRDADGFGDPDPGRGRRSCEPLPGYVSNARDCNDFSASLRPDSLDAWWPATAEDCGGLEARGDVVYVNCHHCPEDDPSCDQSRVGCPRSGGRCNFSRIQDAIEAAPELGVVEVCQGIYRERLDFQGRAVRVQGRATHSVVLTSDGSGLPTVRFVHGEGDSTVLANLTLVGDLYTGLGGGIYIENASPRLEKLHFLGNHGGIQGGALAVVASRGGRAAPLVRAAVFGGNWPTEGDGVRGGGAVAVSSQGPGSEAAPQLEDVYFYENRAAVGGAISAVASARGTVALSILRGRFTRNQAEGRGATLSFLSDGGVGSLELRNVIVEGSSGPVDALSLTAIDGALTARIEQTTWVGNRVPRGLLRLDSLQPGGAIDLEILNSIIAFNEVEDGVVESFYVGGRSSASTRYTFNDFFGNGDDPSEQDDLLLEVAGMSEADLDANASFDPRFVVFPAADTALAELHLAPNSSAVDVIDLESGCQDLDGSPCDLGAYGGLQAGWDEVSPALLGLQSPEPSPEQPGLSRQIAIRQPVPAPLSIGCDERLLDGSRGESLYFSSVDPEASWLDLLGLKAETTYECFVVASNTSGMASTALELRTPPLPAALQDIWTLETFSPRAHTGYTLFNVFPNSFNPHYIVIVDMEGVVRWYTSLYSNSAGGLYDPEALTADTAIRFLPESGELLVGGGESLAALPTWMSLLPNQPPRRPELACASQQDEIHALCDGVSDSTLPEEVPHHETLQTTDGGRVLYLCSEWMPAEGVSLEQFCRDEASRVEGFSIEEWDVSTPEKPVNTWRWSSREQRERCVLPTLPGQLDPYHANALWQEDVQGHRFVYVSLRHRNQVLKIDPTTDEVIYKLGSVRDEDVCPADYAPDPTRCAGYDPTASLCAGRYYEPFTLIPDAADTSCPSSADYVGPDERDPAWFYGQHSPWLERSATSSYRLWLHDNGRNSPDNVEDPTSRGYSRAVQLRVDEAERTAQVDWQYCRETLKGSEDVWFAPAWGSVYPIEDAGGARTDHVLVASSHCNICTVYDDTTSENTFVAEVAADKEVVWSLDLGQATGTYRAQRIDGCYRLPSRSDYLMGTGRWCSDAG